MNNHDESKLVKTYNGKILDVSLIIAEYQNFIEVLKSANIRFKNHQGKNETRNRY